MDLSSAPQLHGDLTRFGLIQFSTKSEMSLQLARHSNWTKLAESVSGMDRFEKKRTNTASALQMALAALKNGMQTRKRYKLQD